VLVVARSHVSLLALVLLAGCRGSAIRPDVVSSEAVVLELPIVEQDELYECGLAAITALCRYHGMELPPGERALLAATARERAGLSGGELQGALERSGFEVYLFEGTLDRAATGVFAHLDRGRPLLVMTSEDGATRHYELLIGYDPALGNLILFDPRRGRVVLPTTAFETLWARAGRFTLLALPGASAAPGPTQAETTRSP